VRLARGRPSAEDFGRATSHEELSFSAAVGGMKAMLCPHADMMELPL